MIKRKKGDIPSLLSCCKMTHFLWLKVTFIGKRKTITNDISMVVCSTYNVLLPVDGAYLALHDLARVHMKGENI